MTNSPTNQTPVDPRAHVLLFNDPATDAIAPMGTMHVTANRDWGNDPLGVIWIDLATNDPRDTIGMPGPAALSGLLMVATYGNHPGMIIDLWVSGIVNPGWSIDVVHDRSHSDVDDQDDLVLTENTQSAEWASDLLDYGVVGILGDHPWPRAAEIRYQQFLSQARLARETF